MAKETEQKKRDLAAEIAEHEFNDWRDNIYGADPENLDKNGKRKPNWEEIKDEAFKEHLVRWDNEAFAGHRPDVSTNYRNIAEDTPEGKRIWKWEVDTAHSGLEHLSPDLKSGYMEMGETIADLLKRKDNGEKISMEQAGQIIREVQLKQSPLEKDGSRGVPFAELPKEKQEEILAKLKGGREIQDNIAKEGKGPIGQFLVDAGLLK